MIKLSELHKVFFKHGLGEEFFEQEPAFIWSQAVGPHIARLTRAIWVKDGVLHIEVFNHAFQHELTLMQEQYKRKLNQTMGEEKVKEIRFRVGPKPQADAKIVKWQEIPLTPEEQKEIETAIATVESSKLKESLSGWMISLKKIEKARKQLGWKSCAECGTLHDDFNEKLCPICRLEQGVFHS
jgi:rubrerythrin